MLNNASGIDHIYIACGYTDRRSGIDRLVALVQSSFKLDPYQSYFRKDLLVEMVLSMSSQMAEMNKQMSLLTERINVMLGAQYGRQTEKSSEIPHQMEFCFNEAEVLITDASKEQLTEPSVEEIVSGPENTDISKNAGLTQKVPVKRC